MASCRFRKNFLSKDEDMNFYEKYFQEISRKLAQTDTELLERVVQAIVAAKKKQKKVILVGNGGSAAIASHISVDLTKNAGIRAINFNEADLLTCFSNDYGYEKWIEKAIGAYADSHDVAILISSSGRSPNILNGAAMAKRLGLKVITFSGFGADNPLRKIGDINLWVDSKEYNNVEAIHNIWLSALVDKIAGGKS